MDQQVGEEIHRLIAQRSDSGIACIERWRMAERAPGIGEQLSAPCNRIGPSRCIGRRRRCRQEAREEGELFDRADHLESRLAIGLGDVVGNRRKLASRGFIALGLKQLVADTHFHVVRLAGEQQEGFVLGLPSKPRDRAVIAVVVRLAGDRMASEDNIGPAVDPECFLLGCVIDLVRKDHLVRDLFDQAGAKHRGRNPEDHVAARELLLEVRLRKHASRCVRPSGVPSAFFTNLASRTGPFGVINDGTVLVAPFTAANATWGFTAGLVPPTAGCKWQPPQLPRFIVGPRPSATVSSSSKSSLPALKNASSVLVSPAMGAPAPAAPPRTPGSLAAEDESSEDGISSRKRKKAMTTSTKISAITAFLIATPSSPRDWTPGKELNSVLYSSLRGADGST